VQNLRSAGAGTEQSKNCSYFVVSIKAVLISLLGILISQPAIAKTYSITTDCKTTTTESPASGTSATDGLIEVLPGDLIEITFQDWTSKT
jgi:hypothetical protein